MRRSIRGAALRAAMGAGAAAGLVGMTAAIVPAGSAATIQGLAATDATSQPVDPIMLSASPAESVYGQPETLTATMSPIQPGLPLPTGNVDFLDGTTVLGTVALTSDNFSRIVLTVSDLSGGSHSITAVYEGDSTWGSSTSPAVTVVVDRAPTSLQAGPVPFASLVTGPLFSATLTTDGAPLAGRRVRFSVGSTTACRAVTDAHGVASCSALPTVTPLLLLAGHYTAGFAGDVDYLPSSATGTVAGP